jgi:hypothetical protein
MASPLGKLDLMPIIKTDGVWFPTRVLKIHMRREKGFSLCGLMWTDGEATEEPANVTCERCLAIMKARAT